MATVSFSCTGWGNFPRRYRWMFALLYRLDLLCRDKSCCVHSGPGEISWSKRQSSRSHNLALSLHSSLTRQVGSSTILERLLWWHPRHEQWHTPMANSSAFKVNWFFFFFPNFSTVIQWKLIVMKNSGLDEQYQCTAVLYFPNNPWLFCLSEDSTPWQQHRKMVCLLASVIETCLVLPGSYLSQRKPSYHYCHLKEMNATNHIQASGMSRPNQAWFYHGNLPRHDQLGCREPLGLWEFNGLFLLSLLKAHNL